MEYNNEPNSEMNHEPENEMTVVPETEPMQEQTAEQLPNLTVCPNCLEPNTDGLAVCKYCGMPLHPGAENEDFVPPEDEMTLEANRREAAPEPKKTEKKKEESGFRRVMPWLGLYIIYYAITGIIQTSREEELANPGLAYGSWAVYIVAGLLMAWPLIKKGWEKIHPSAAGPEDSDEGVTEEPVESELSAEDAAEADVPADGEGSGREENETDPETAGTAYQAEQDDSASEGLSADAPADSDPLLSNGAVSEENNEEGFEEDEASKWL